jgi:putative ABC transport system ATP-binding protein
MSDEAIIKVCGACKTYRVGDIDVPALRGVDLEVRRGEFLSIMGPSGSGKSTLFHILGGLTPATSGTIRIDGRDLGNMTPADRTRMRRTTIGFVFQKYNLLPTLSAENNIRLAMDIARQTREFDKRFHEVLAILGIAKRLHHKPRALSGGEQQRVAIARAIVNHPAILLADEPTGNLDTTNAEAVLTLLTELNRLLGQTTLMITHNPEAAAYGHRTVQMRDGQVVA